MLELPRAYSKDNIRKTRFPCKCLLKCEGKIWAFITILHRFWSFQRNLYASDWLTNLYACNSRFKIRKSITEKLFLCVLQKSFKTVKASFTCLLKSGSDLTIFFVIIICFNDSSSKMMKNAFYFILKTIFVLNIFKFLSWIFGHVEKQLH